MNILLENNRSKLSVISQLSIYVVMIIMLLSMKPWFIWNYHYMYMALFVVLFLLRIVILMKRKIIFVYDMPILPIVFFTFWLFWIGFSSINVKDLFSSIVIQILPLFFVLSMSISEKIKLKEVTMRIFAAILAVSILFYILFIVGFWFSYSVLDHPTNKTYNGFANFYFFILPIRFYSLDFLRFSSVFTEPGHLGMMCALYLYVNEYEVKKWYNMVMLIALLLSFSFAAYVLLLLGWMIYIWCKRKNIKSAIISVLVVLFCSCSLELYTSDNFSSGIVSTLILNRMEYDEERGISGNNRNDEKFMAYYESFSNTEDYFFGIGKEKYSLLFDSTQNSSYKTFILQYGIIGTGIFISIFLSLICCRPSRMAWGLFLLFLLSFLQRPYWYWSAQSFMFIVSVAIFYYERSMKMNKASLRTW